LVEVAAFADTEKLTLERWPRTATAPSVLRWLPLVLGLLSVTLLCACGGGSHSGSNQAQGLIPPPPAGSINRYFGTDGDLWTATVDHSNDLITGRDITLNQFPLNGSAAGTFVKTAGFLNVTLSPNGTPPNLVGQKGGFALEIPGRAALLRFGDVSNLLIPLAPTAVCPAFTGNLAFQYVTLPNSTWAQATDTAYGTFQASATSNNWTISNITQYALAGGPPSNPGTGLPPAYCGLGAEGYVITAPSNASNPPVATVTLGVGPSGFFVEDNGSAQGLPQGVVSSNALGAGVGAIGVLQPSRQLTTASVVGGQYLGYYEEPGANALGAPVTQLVSFGCSGSGCSVPSSSTAIVGGIFPNDDPTQPPNQDTTLDLGPQDPSNNGLYRTASITVQGVQFPAVAVVGNPEGKFVIFVIAQDTINSVPLLICLFQQ
jgi:hypothetical protein